MTPRARAQSGEHVQAAERAVLGLTAAVCLQAGVLSAVAGDPLAVIAVPAVAVVVLLIRGSIVRAAYVAALAWTLFLPHAAGEALIVPLAMSVGCLAIAIGPGRLMDWVGEDFGGRPPPGDAPRGWIEDDPRA